MKKNLCVLALLIGTLHVFSQNPFRVWVNRFDQNQASDGDVPGSLEITPDGGYMAVSNSGSSAFSILKYSSTGSLQWGRDFSPGNGRCGVPLSDGSYVGVGNNGYLEAVKTDANGNVLWGKNYLAGTQGNYVQQTLDGGLLMGGYGSNGAVLIKTDINGVVQWAKNYTYSSANLIIHKGVQLSDSSYVLGACGGNGMVLYKTDKVGALQWAHEYSLTGVISYTMSLRKTSDHGFIMAGTDNDQFWHVMKTDSAGNVQWSNKYKPASPQGATYDVEELDYGYAVVGMYYDGIGYSASYLMKIDPSGNVVWTRIFQEQYWNEFHSVKQTADKGLVMWGRVQNSSGQYGDLVKTDSLGLGVCGDSTVAMVATAFTTNVTSPSISVSNASSTVNAVTNTYSGGTPVVSSPCQVPPVVAFSANRTNVCQGDTVLFQDHSSNNPTTWQWTFSKGTPGSSTSQNPAIVYDTIGTFSVKLVATNTYGTDSTTTTGYITVSAPPVPGTVSAAPDSVCPGSSSQLSVSGSNGTIQWQSSANGVLYSDISLANSTTYATPSLAQTTWYRVDVSSECGTDSSAAVSVLVIALPVTGTITASPDTVCPGNSSLLTISGSAGTIQWQSSFTGGNYTNTGSADTTYNTSALTQSTNYRVVVSNGVCADTSAVVPVMIYPSLPVPLLTVSDSVFCASDSALITSSGPYISYRWSDGDTTNSTYVNASGGYWVSVTDANGCSAVSSHQAISVYPVTSVSIVVQGDTLSSFNSSYYQWFYNNSALPGDTLSVYVAPQSGQYAVEVIDTNGCKELSEYTQVTVMGVEGPVANHTLNIYPDPFNNAIFITGNELNDNMDYIKLYNALGKEVLSKNMDGANPNNISLDVSGLPAGSYYLQIKTGDVEYVRKMIKD